MEAEKVANFQLPCHHAAGRLYRLDKKVEGGEIGCNLAKTDRRCQMILVRCGGGSRWHGAHSEVCARNHARVRERARWRSGGGGWSRLQLRKVRIWRKFPLDFFSLSSRRAQDAIQLRPKFLLTKNFRFLFPLRLIHGGRTTVRWLKLFS